MTDSDRLAISWFHLSGEFFSAGLTLIVVAVILERPLLLLCTILCFLASFWFDRKAVRAQLEARRSERTMDQH
jgi:hypothetical protein